MAALWRNVAVATPVQPPSRFSRPWSPNDPQRSVVPMVFRDGPSAYLAEAQLHTFGAQHFLLDSLPEFRAFGGVGHGRMSNQQFLKPAAWSQAE
jgi:hypothetical protein